MTEHRWLSFAPVLAINLHAVFRCYRAHNDLPTDRRTLDILQAVCCQSCFLNIPCHEPIVA